MASISMTEVRKLAERIEHNGVRNRHLSSICQLIGLRSSGNKIEMQTRITDAMQQSLISHDFERFHQIRQSIDTIVPTRATSAASSLPASHYNIHSAPGTMQRTTGIISAGPGTMGPYHDRLHHPARLMFKDSPFYDIVSQIKPICVCERADAPEMTVHKNIVKISLLSTLAELRQCQIDSSMRIMLFCAGDASGTQDISFPQHCELQVNGIDIKANLKGVKNKPGSTRPVDITKRLKCDQGTFLNQVDFTYAKTTKAFYLVAYLCKVTTVEELVEKIKAGKKISKESVITEFARNSQDQDVVATSQVLSLKCPISFVRLRLPCRSIACTHVQCFDATFYLELQEQGPQWLCPICNKPAPFNQLAIDEYVTDILKRTPSSLDQVTLEPDGCWNLGNNSAGTPDNRKRRISEISGNDDLVVVSSSNAVGGGHSVTSTPQGSSLSGGTPRPTAPRQTPTSTSGTKRQIEVVDLTLSSDEDDNRPLVSRPAKRQNTGTGNGYPGPSGHSSHPGHL